MEKANELIKKIFDIDNSALKMSQAADNEKRDAYNEYNKKIVEFDKKLAKDYQEKYQAAILEIDNEINNEKETEYIELETEMKEFAARNEAKKDIWVNEIIKDITGV